jgi:DNA adenine methylase
MFILDFYLFKKAVGGKSQIIDKIIENFPNEINNYYEPFVGGGSVLLTLLTYSKNNLIKINGKINAYDINDTLINMYKNIQNSHLELYYEIQKIINEYNNCGVDEMINREAENLEEAMLNKENYYYWIRKNYNIRKDIDSISYSAMFIFLNKTCFRGLYRIGPNGFNVPYGNYKNPFNNRLWNIHFVIIIITIF